MKILKPYSYCNLGFTNCHCVTYIKKYSKYILKKGENSLEIQLSRVLIEEGFLISGQNFRAKMMPYRNERYGFRIGVEILVEYDKHCELPSSNNCVLIRIPSCNRNIRILLFLYQLKRVLELFLLEVVYLQIVLHL